MAAPMDLDGLGTCDPDKADFTGVTYPLLSSTPLTTSNPVLAEIRVQNTGRSQRDGLFS